jgi:hypothetical protein
LSQIGTVTGTIERDLTLFAATLWADPPMNGWTEAFFLAKLADYATQIEILLSNIMALRQEPAEWLVRLAKIHRKS